VRIERALSIADLRRMARRRLPKILFELIESGVEDEYALASNREIFRKYRLLPRYLTDIALRDQRVSLFGRSYASPFGVAPTGFAGLLRRDADLHLAGACAAANIPFILSGASVAGIEAVAEAAPKHIWAHLYPAKDATITRRFMDRVGHSGVECLVLTVDNPVYPKRERDTRNGFVLPLRLRLPILLEALTHPGWIMEYLGAGGMPMLESWREYAPSGASPGDVAAFFRSQSPSIQTWDSLAQVRAAWAGKLVLKGIQHPDDARRAAEAGVDGLILSNHGGKSFDPLPSPLASLPAIRTAVGDRLPVMLDSGIRRGWEMLVAKALGADFLWVGRATLYGVAAGGRQGADRAISILRSEVDTSLAMVGSDNFAAIGPEFIREA
jgi:L-lactate dehydrogenase (cytochrome)/(S)-mandelate dehydrogenase